MVNRIARDNNDGVQLKIEDRPRWKEFSQVEEIFFEVLKPGI